jgi:ferredoxin-NADP reductase
MLAGEFEGFQKRYPQFQWKNVMTARATFDELNTLAEGLDNPAFLICGPPAFMKGARKFLKKQGVSSSNIHTEEFSPW